MFGRSFRRGAVAAVGLVLVSIAAGAAPLETKSQTFEQSEPIRRVFMDGPAAVAVLGEGDAFTITIDGGRLELVRRTLGAVPERPAEILPDGVVSRGTRNISRAWLTGAAGRYGHGVLGDAIEAGGVAVELADGRRLALELGNESVFEDRIARIWDLDGDGRDEVVAVRSYLDRGAALAVIAPGRDVLRVIAETPAIGLANRWLNPVGTGDFDGDGRPEVAYVETPHIGGTLRVFALMDGRLVRKYSREGFSNHTLGERELGKSAVVDADGDGTPDMAVPDSWRRTLRVVTFKGGRFTELARIEHGGSPVATAVVAADLDGDGRNEVVYGLSDRRLVAVRFGR